MSAGRARATFAERLARRAQDAPIALCAGIDPSPDALALLDGITTTGSRTTRAGAIERFGGLVVEAVRDDAVAIKPQLAWFEVAGAPGLRALERIVEYARTAGLLVVLDGKRGDIPHSAAAYADAWLGDDAASGIRGDALTVNAAVGSDALEAMAQIAHERSCALYALLVTSNPGAEQLQAAELADGTPWWELLAAQIDRIDREICSGGVVGAVAGATRPHLLERIRSLLPTAPLLLPGVGAQGGEASALKSAFGADAPASLVPVSRSLLPRVPMETSAFRHHVARTAGEIMRDISGVEPGVSTAVR